MNRFDLIQFSRLRVKCLRRDLDEIFARILAFSLSSQKVHSLYHHHSKTAERIFLIRHLITIFQISPKSPFNRYAADTHFLKWQCSTWLQHIMIAIELQLFSTRVWIALENDERLVGLFFIVFYSAQWRSTPFYSLRRCSADVEYDVVWSCLPAGGNDSYYRYNTRYMYTVYKEANYNIPQINGSDRKRKRER